ncbi:MAG: methyltransferase domain-containing protein, partial [Planctomycetes bacterium]|nr:methyltransferase domain-containing protein [Planctomycetota bacterium]
SSSQQPISRRRLGASFSASRKTYDAAAEFHLRLAQRLSSRVRELQQNFARALEIGTHTGLQTTCMLPCLQKEGTLITSDIYKVDAPEIAALDSRRHLRLVCSGEALPFRRETFDLIFSGSVFQWFEDWDESMDALISNLECGGILAFSQFLAPSLEPLRSLFAEVGESARFVELAHEEAWRARLSRFTVLSVDVLHHTFHFDTPRDLFNWMKRVGIRVSAERDRPLGKAALKEIVAALETQRDAEGVPLHLCAGAVLIRKD